MNAALVGAGTPPAASIVTATALGGAMSGGVMNTSGPSPVSTPALTGTGPALVNTQT